MKTTSILTPYGPKFTINADCAASGLIDEPIEAFMRHNVYPHYSNTHSNAHNGKLMAHYIEEAKKLIRKSVKAQECDRVIFTGNGCSGAINHLIHCLDLRRETSPQTIVFLSVAEHHSNYLPWTHLPVKIEIIPLIEDGTIDLDLLEEKLESYPEHPKIGSFIAGSNVTGVLQPVYELATLMHKYGGIALMDYAGCAPYVPIDLHHDEMSYFDAIFVSPHKFVGGPGTPGLLIANHKLFANEEPYCPSGGTVRFVCRKFVKYSDNLETKETGGTPNILGCIKAGLIFQMKDQMMDQIIAREQAINQKVCGFLSKLSTLQLLNKTCYCRKVPIYSFIVPNLHYNFVVVLLSDLFGIQSRGGVSCCSLLAQWMLKMDSQKQENIYQTIVSNQGVPSNYGWCRVTFHYTMEDYVVDYILEAIKYVAEHGASYLPKYRYDPQKNNWIHREFTRKFPPLDLNHRILDTRTDLTPELLATQRQAIDSIRPLGKIVYRFITEKK